MKGSLVDYGVYWIWIHGGLVPSVGQWIAEKGAWRLPGTVEWWWPSEVRVLEYIGDPKEVANRVR